MITSKDVTNVEYSRMLKRTGAPQETEAYWQGLMPSLSTIQGMSAIASENKGKVRWILTLGKPPEPNASAYSVEELKAYLTKLEKPLPILRQQDKYFFCSTGEKEFNAEIGADAFAQAVLYITKV